MRLSEAVRYSHPVRSSSQAILNSSAETTCQRDGRSRSPHDLPRAVMTPGSCQADWHRRMTWNAGRRAAQDECAPLATADLTLSTRVKLVAAAFIWPRSVNPATARSPCMSTSSCSRKQRPPGYRRGVSASARRDSLSTQLARLADTVRSALAHLRETASPRGRMARRGMLELVGLGGHAGFPPGGEQRLPQIPAYQS